MARRPPDEGRDAGRRIASRVAKIRKELESGIMEAGRHLYDVMRERASLVDHTLADLANMGHPYRVRDGGFAGETQAGEWRAGIRSAARAEREAQLTHDIKLVHEQSGTLLSAMYMEKDESRRGVAVRVGVDPVEAPHVEYVVKGTTKMIPRDFIGMAAVEARPGIHRAIRKALERAKVAR